MQTLAEKYPEGVAFLKKAGFTSLARLTARCSTCVQMDKLIGTKNAVNHWMNERHLPHTTHEVTATMILREQDSDHGKSDQTELGMESEYAGPSVSCDARPGIRMEDIKPVEYNQVDDETPTEYLVVIPSHKVEKVLKLLTMMDCEWVDLVMADTAAQARNRAASIEMAVDAFAGIENDEFLFTMEALIEARAGLTPKKLEAFAMWCSRRADDMERQSR